MEPRIQYAQTKDGVSIAFYTLGKGMPLVEMYGPPTHLQMEWQIPEFRGWFERLAEKRQMVRFDSRGNGLSDRDVDDYSLEARVLDLEAEVERLDLGRMALDGSWFNGTLAISYEALHPEQVSHLILYNTFARASDLMGTPQAQGLLALMDKDWELFTETYARVGLGWSAGESAQRYAALVRESVTPEYLQKYFAAFAAVDVTNLLQRVRCPTLVLQRGQQVQVLGVDLAKGLTSRIPDARLALLEGDSVGEYLQAAATAIEEFLGEGEEAAKAPSLAAEDIHTILFTDVEGSTALTQRLGDAKAREVLREHERMVREALKAHGGSEVKTMGDGFIASFSSATKALQCSIAMQRAFAEHNESAAEPIRVRIGLNAGEPIAEDEDLFGTAVNLAARICSLAEAGQILAPIVVRELAAGKQFMFADLGETELRGFEDPVRLYELRWREAG